MTLGVPGAPWGIPGASLGVPGPALGGLQASLGVAASATDRFVMYNSEIIYKFLRCPHGLR